ncbi:MAG: glycosyltransferase N-terminal domain-containing protein [Flavobacteriales bacterium]|nr:glycosyltransferase N-terminal domain-containing protein [Flavobacteriales bacterium]
MPLVLLRIGSVLWAWLLRLLAGLGHARAQSRAAIRREGHEAVLQGSDTQRMWFHVSSLGELEQAIPVMQAYRALHPDTSWLLTVYSPSAWHPLQAKGVATVVGGWRQDDVLAVLPDDLPGTWRTWLEALNLRGLAMAKYDLWPNLLAACQGRSIPIHVFAAAPSSTRPNPKPSTPALWRLATTLSVQDAAAADAFACIGLKDNVSVDGDPRVERVLTRSANPGEVWRGWAASAGQVVVAGSTWSEEERALRSMDWHPQRRLVLVPHDISEPHLADLDRQWEGGAIRASAWLALDAAARALWSVVIVDSTGMLFDLYRIGTVAVVGGGHGTGLHNVLEPASAGLPIVTGPDLGAFREAHALEALGALTAGDVADLTTAWLADAASCHQFGQAGKAWLEAQRGASERIVTRWS